MQNNAKQFNKNIILPLNFQEKNQKPHAQSNEKFYVLSLSLVLQKSLLLK